MNVRVHTDSAAVTDMHPDSGAITVMNVHPDSAAATDMHPDSGAITVLNVHTDSAAVTDMHPDSAAITHECTSRHCRINRRAPRQCCNNCHEISLSNPCQYISLLSVLFCSQFGTSR